LNSIKLTNIVKGIQRRGKTTVEAENLSLNQRSKGKIVEEIRKIFPHIGGPILSQTFIIKAVHLGDLTAFVISSENRNSMSVANFQCDKKRNGLDGEVASIDVISHEEVVGVRCFPTDFKKLDQIMELAMNITTNRYRKRNRLNI
jgi:hypothetical protein